MSLRTKNFDGEISDNWPSGLFEINLYKNHEFCWYLLLTTWKWTNITSVISKWGLFSPFLSLVILFSELPSNFTVSGVKSSRWYAALILNAIPFSIVLIYIIAGGLSASVLCPLMIY